MADQTADEEADVKRWMQALKKARKYDEPAREQYARDRRYARGDSGFEVDANLIGTYIDIMSAFLYAQNPDVDVRPAAAASMPSSEALNDAAEQSAEVPPEVLQAIQQQAMQAVQAGTPPDQAEQAAAKASQFAHETAVKQQVAAMRKAFSELRAANKAFAETLELVINRLWHDGAIKPRGVRWVRAALTVGTGVLKASWQERTAPSPETVTRINDLQAALQRAQASRAALDEQAAPDDADIAEYQRQIDALHDEAQEVTARGFVVDLVASEDFQVAPGYAIADHVDAPWNAQRRAMLLEDARAEFTLDEDQVKQAKRYTAKKPVMRESDSALVLPDVGAKDADAFEASEDDAKGGGTWVMAWEIWDRQSGSVLTAIEGIKQWVKPAWQPSETTQWYPFFVLAISEVDGQRHPQSLVSRSVKLVDEYNRIGTNEAEHRRRCLPGILFNEGQIGQEAMTSINTALIGEYIGVRMTQPNTPMSSLFFPKPYPPLDPALYDRQRVVQELERIWGVQEALSGAINVAKTATEAQIQQSGFQARSASRRDELETKLTELALYTAEIARHYLDGEDVRNIAGSNAMWPEPIQNNDLATMVEVDIRAGSSGKPDTTAERQAWATQLPLLQQAVVQIGQLRQSDPADIADALEMLLQITAERSGDRVDIDQLVPKAGNAAPMLPGPGNPAPPGAGPPPPDAPQPHGLPPPIGGPGPQPPIDPTQGTL